MTLQGLKKVKRTKGYRPTIRSTRKQLFGSTEVKDEDEEQPNKTKRKKGRRATIRTTREKLFGGTEIKDEDTEKEEEKKPSGGMFG